MKGCANLKKQTKKLLDFVFLKASKFFYRYLRANFKATAVGEEYNGIINITKTKKEHGLNMNYYRSQTANRLKQMSTNVSANSDWCSD